MIGCQSSLRQFPTTAGSPLLDPDPRDLLVPFPGADDDRPLSTRVNKPENDGPSILEPVEVPLEKRAMVTFRLERGFLEPTSTSLSLND